MKRDEHQDLIGQLLDGVISETDFLKLEAEMHVDPEVRALYYEMNSLEQGLADYDHSAESLTSAPRSRPLGSSWKWGLVGAAAVCLLLALSGLFEESARPPLALEQPVKQEQKAQGFAVLTGQTGAKWAQGASFLNSGLLPPGVHHLESGLVQLELFSGVNLVVEGAAEFEIISPMEMRLASGKLRAFVPEPAQGFKIHTSEGEIVDLGTEFALNATTQGAELHVISGEVEWHPYSSEMTLLETGEGTKWHQGSHVKTSASATDFVGLDEFAVRQKQLNDSRFEAWQSEIDELLKDQRLIAHYDMDALSKSHRTLESHSELASRGAVVAAKQTTDRWGRARGAYDFSPTGSRVRITVPGRHSSLTFACWVKINSLDRMYNSLFLTDGHDLNEPHWQILDDGRIFFSVKKFEKGTPDKHIYYSNPIWNQSISGQWMHIATTYDLESSSVSHYVNGSQVSSEPIPQKFRVETVQIGAGSIGNWSQPLAKYSPSFAVRNLNGSIDEFFIFSGALSSEEVTQLYLNAKP